MKTLEEAGYHFYFEINKKRKEQHQIPPNCWHDWLMVGARLAQEWFDVNKEMPEPTEENFNSQFLVKGYYQVEDLKGDVRCYACKMDKFTFDSIKKIVFDTSSGFITTHWRPIERK